MISNYDKNVTKVSQEAIDKFQKDLKEVIQLFLRF